MTSGRCWNSRAIECCFAASRAFEAEPAPAWLYDAVGAVGIVMLMHEHQFLSSGVPDDTFMRAFWPGR